MIFYFCIATRILLIDKRGDKARVVSVSQQFFRYPRWWFVHVVVAVIRCDTSTKGIYTKKSKECQTHRLKEKCRKATGITCRNKLKLQPEGEKCHKDEKGGGRQRAQTFLGFLKHALV